MQKIILILSGIIILLSIHAPAIAKKAQWIPLKFEAQQAITDAQEDGIWGIIRFYTNHRITLANGQRFDFSHNVLIDTETLTRDKRGNVRILLDDSGKAKAILFNGIDMPDVIRRFKR